MKKKSLIVLIGILLILAACSEEKVIKDKEDDMKEEVINVPEGIDKISVTGYYPAIFIEDEEQPQERKFVFEKEKEIEMFLKAIKNSSVPSGDITSEGENFRIVLSYQDGNSDTILLWLYPDKNSGRIQKENHTDQVRILSEEDVQSIAKLLEEQFRNTLTDTIDSTYSDGDVSISILAEQERYDQGETPVITIKNDGETAVDYGGEGTRLEYLQDDAWVAVNSDEVQFDNLNGLEPNQKIKRKFSTSTFGKGVYRVIFKFNVISHKERSSKRVAVSFYVD